MLMLARNVMQPLHYSSSGATFQRTLRSLFAAAMVRAALGVCSLVQSPLKVLKNKKHQPRLCLMSSLRHHFFTPRLRELQPTAQTLPLCTVGKGGSSPPFIRRKQGLLALQGVNSSAPRGFLPRHRLQSHLVFSGQTSRSWRKAATIKLPTRESTSRSPASSNQQRPGTRLTVQKMIFTDESKALFSPGLPRSSGVISDRSPCCWTRSKAGGATHRRGEVARNAQLGLQFGEPGKGMDESRTGLVGLGLFALDPCPDLTFGLKGEGSQIIPRT